jgi:hypothetical protein
VSNYAADLILAAVAQLNPAGSRKGKLPTARARRSLSTAYYALFHFVLEEATKDLVGTHNDLRRRRRTLGRVFTHSGIKNAFDKISGSSVDLSVAELLRPRRLSSARFAAPSFARELARTFADLQAKRHEADYDLNTPIGAADAHLAITRVIRVVGAWRAADTQGDRDFKHALSMLMLLKGQLRRET